MVLEVSVVETLGDVGRLLLNRDEDVASLVVETLLGRVVTDALDRVTDDLLVVDVGLGGDLTENHDHSRLGGGFASDLVRAMQTRQYESAQNRTRNLSPSTRGPQRDTRRGWHPRLGHRSCLNGGSWNIVSTFTRGSEGVLFRASRNNTW